MSKHTIKIPPLQPGDGVSWTFEMSAAAENGTRAKTTARKRRRAKASAKETPSLETMDEPTMAWLSEPVSVQPESAPSSTTWPAPETTAAPTLVNAAEAVAALEIECVAVAASTPAPETATGPAMSPHTESIVPLESERALLSAKTPATDGPRDLEGTVAFAQAPTPAATSREAQRPTAPPRRSRHLRIVALAGAAVVVLAVLAFPRHPAPLDRGNRLLNALPAAQERADHLVAPSAPPASPASAPTVARVTASATDAPRLASASAPRMSGGKPEKKRVAESTTLAPAIEAVLPATDILASEETAARMPASEAADPAPTAGISTGIGGSVPVTITGCLEISVEQDAFRLTDTEGTDAPKSRSWRTGFLKKRSAPVALVEPADRLALQAHVGHRVAATGLLVSHDLKVSGLRVVGPSCN